MWRLWRHNCGISSPIKRNFLRFRVFNGNNVSNHRLKFNNIISTSQFMREIPYYHERRHSEYCKCPLALINVCAQMDLNINIVMENLLKHLLWLLGGLTLKSHPCSYAWITLVTHVVNHWPSISSPSSLALLCLLVLAGTCSYFGPLDPYPTSVVWAYHISMSIVIPSR